MKRQNTKSKFLTLFLIVCLVSQAFLFTFNLVPNVYAALPSQTVKYWSSTADGYVTNSTLPHATCTAGVAGTVTNTTTTSYVGQKMDNSSFVTLYPSAAGDLTEWAALSGNNWANVDEVGEHDSDTSYVYASATGAEDLYNVGNPAIAPDAWAQITVTAVVKKVTTNSFLRLIIKTDGTIYTGSWQSVSSTSYDAGYKSQTWTLNPKYGYSWNITSLNALQIGIEINTTTPIVRCTQVYVECYYCSPSIYRAAEYFDTSSIPDSATITAATMYLYVTTDKAETSFNLLIENSTSGVWPANPLSTTSYNKANYLASAGGAFTMFGVTGVVDLSLNATGLAMISKTSITKLFLISSRDKAGTVCGFQSTNDEEYVIFASQESTTALWRPYLQVTWTNESPQFIYADSFSSAEATWSVVGTTPYVDDSSTSYIQSFTATNESWFGFPDPTALPSQIWLEVEAQGGAVATYCNITLEEGTVNTTIATVCFDRFTSWKSYNVTAILSTVTKLQAARVKFVSLNATTAFGNRIYRLRLRLYTGPVPLYNTLGVSTPEVNTTATFSCQWNGAVTASLTQNSTGSLVTTNVTISSGWGNLTALLPTNSANTVLYWFYANDSSNVWERTENYTLKLMWSSYDATAYNMVNSNTSSLAHSLGRQLFFDTTTNLYWIKYFYNNGSWINLVWSFSSDGKEWTYGGIMRDNVNASDGTVGMGWGYWLLEQRGGVSYCHIQFADELVASPIYYRRGLLVSDGNITFTAWDTAVPSLAGSSLAVEGMTISPSGHVWMGYEVDPNEVGYSHGYGNITMSTETDGSWTTHASYPQKFIDNNGAIFEGLIFSTGQDYYAIMVYCQSSNATVNYFLRSMEIQNNVLQSVVNASNSATYEARFYSVAKDDVGNLHLAYVNYSGAINYCKWNTTLWNVKDTNVGSSLLAGDPVGYPVVSTHKTVNETYVNWVAGGDWWLNVYNGTSNAWRGLERMHGLTGQREYSDPNHVIEQVDQYVLFAFNVYNWTTGTTEIWSYLYAVTLVARIAFTNIGSNSTIASQPVLLYAYATESGGVGMSHANVRYYDGSEWDTSTYIVLSGALTAWTNFTKTLPMSIIAVVQWQIAVNDTNGQWAYTDIQNISLTVNLTFILGDSLTFPITSVYLKALHVPINDAVQFLTADMLLKNILFTQTANLRPSGGTSTIKGLTNAMSIILSYFSSASATKSLQSLQTQTLRPSTETTATKTLQFLMGSQPKFPVSTGYSATLVTTLTTTVGDLIRFPTTLTTLKGLTSILTNTARFFTFSSSLKSLQTIQTQTVRPSAETSATKALQFLLFNQPSFPISTEYSSTLVTTLTTTVGDLIQFPTTLTATKTLQSVATSHLFFSLSSPMQKALTTTIFSPIPFPLSTTITILGPPATQPPTPSYSMPLIFRVATSAVLDWIQHIEMLIYDQNVLADCTVTLQNPYTDKTVNATLTVQVIDQQNNITRQVYLEAQEKRLENFTLTFPAREFETRTYNVTATLEYRDPASGTAISERLSNAQVVVEGTYFTILVLIVVASVLALIVGLGVYLLRQKYLGWKKKPEVISDFEGAITFWLANAT